MIGRIVAESPLTPRKQAPLTDPNPGPSHAPGFDFRFKSSHDSDARMSDS